LIEPDDVFVQFDFGDTGTVKVAVAGGGNSGPVLAPASSPPASRSSVSADVLKKVIDNLRKMGDDRPVKPASSGRRCRLKHAAALSRARGARALIPSHCA